VFFLVTPNHPYDDYRILSLGYWHLLEKWHRKIAGLPNVLGFSQYTEALTEPVTPQMKYWSDPLHPSLRFGDMMLRAVRGDTGAEVLPDTLVRMNPSTVEHIISTRRKGLEHWIARNGAFVEAFKRAGAVHGLHVN
jgi:hypothetical protein